MAAGMIILPQYMPARDRNGRLVSGAKLAVYVNRTTTKATVYTDSALATPQANPITANASGQFPIIWAPAGEVEAPVLYTLAVSGPNGESIGNPAVFNDWQPSLDAAVVSAALNSKVNLDGGNIPDAAQFRTAIGSKTASDVPMVYDGRPATLFDMGISYRLRTNASGRFLGGLWASETAAFASVEAKFDETNTIGAGGSPAAALYVFADAAGTTKDVVAVLGVCWASANDQTVFGFNFIAACETGLTGIKFVGGELDVLIPNGVTPSPGTLGLAINAFNYPFGCGAALLLGAVGGGKWSDGIVVGGIRSTGAGVAGSAGDSMGSLVNSGAATYVGDTPFIASNGHRRQMSGPANVHNKKWVDGSGVTIEQLSSGNSIVRNAAGGQIYAMTQSGVVAIGENASAFSGYQLDVACTINAEGVGIFRAANPTPTAAAAVFVANGADGNAAACAMRVRANSVSGRSINVGGTVNVAGADYAEYERRNARMIANALTFLKGDIVGFDADGLLTNLWSEAVSFGVKSTNPSLVGGDEVFRDLPEAPQPPVFEPPAYVGAPDPGPVPHSVDYPAEYGDFRSVVVTAVGAAQAEIKAAGAKDAEADAIRARHLTPEVHAALAAIEEIQARRTVDQQMAEWEWQAAFIQFEHDAVVHEASVSEAEAVFERETIPAWRSHVETWSALMDEARAPFDRIAYCGKVPVNVTGATVGQYLIPQMGPDDSISVRIVDHTDMTVGDMLASLGRVRRVLDDGRAEIVVRVG